MKKMLGLAVAALVCVMCFSSCGKKCVCTRYEDGKKIYSTTDNDVRIFDKKVCTDGSQDAYQGYSVVTDGKEVTVEVKCK